MDAILALSLHKSPAPDLAAEANHRIANNLALLITMVRIQARSVKDKAKTYSNAEVHFLLDGMAARINTISQLHRRLAHTPQGGVISLKPHLHDVTDALTAALSSPQQQVRIMHTGGDCLVLTRHAQTIALILCEIFINAMKYAHPAGVPLKMVVDCEPAADGRLVLSVMDDGVGLPEGFVPEQSSGLGFKVMYRLAAEIGGELQIVSTGLGLSFRLSLPATAMAGARLA
jgi:two-component sensor histidine kinase